MVLLRFKQKLIYLHVSIYTSTILIVVTQRFVRLKLNERTMFTILLNTDQLCRRSPEFFWLTISGKGDKRSGREQGVELNAPLCLGFLLSTKSSQAS
jgi:hypothetical protein